MSTAERQKVADGLAGLLAETTKILAALDGVHVGAEEEPPPSLARSLKDRAFRERMRARRLSRRPGEKGGA